MLVRIILIDSFKSIQTLENKTEQTSFARAWNISTEKISCYTVTKCNQFSTAWQRCQAQTQCSHFLSAHNEAARDDRMSFPPTDTERSGSRNAGRRMKWNDRAENNCTLYLLFSFPVPLYTCCPQPTQLAAKGGKDLLGDGTARSGTLSYVLIEEGKFPFERTIGESIRTKNSGDSRPNRPHLMLRIIVTVIIILFHHLPAMENDAYLISIWYKKEMFSSSFRSPSSTDQARRGGASPTRSFPCPQWLLVRQGWFYFIFSYNKSRTQPACRVPSWFLTLVHFNSCLVIYFIIEIMWCYQARTLPFLCFSSSSRELSVLFWTSVSSEVFRLHDGMLYFCSFLW